MTTPEWTVELPEDWRTAAFRPGFVRVIGEAALPRGRSALMVLGLLKDGTNVLALTWDKGRRIARACPDTNWALEERYLGRPPGKGEGCLIDAWRVGVEALAESGRASRADMARPDFELPPAAAVLCNEKAMDLAYERYCEADVPEVSREAFELGVEILAADQLENEAREA